MIKKRHGEIFEFENVRYSIGDWVRCTEDSDYAGLTGVIVEIRDGEDRETENTTPDIYVFKSPKIPSLSRNWRKGFQSCMGRRLKSRTSRWI